MPAATATSTFFPYSQFLNPAQRNLLLRLASLVRLGEGAACVAKPHALQVATKTRPTLVHAGGRSREGIAIALTPTAAGMEIVSILAAMTSEEAKAQFRSTADILRRAKRV